MRVAGRWIGIAKPIGPASLTLPATTIDGQHAPGLRFADPRVMAVMTAIVGFSHLINGFDNKTLTELMGTLLNMPFTSWHATYDLRRLGRKRVIERIEHTHRYRLTPSGRAIAVLFTKAFERVLGPGLTALDPRLPPELAGRSPLAHAWRQLNRALDDHRRRTDRRLNENLIWL